MPTILIPSTLRKFTGQQRSVVVEGIYLQEVLHQLITVYPKIKPYVLDTDDKLCLFVCIYLNDIDIRQLNHLKTAIAPTDIITIVSAVAGG